jgi:hypothetical protein
MKNLLKLIGLLFTVQSTKLTEVRNTNKLYYVPDKAPVMVEYYKCSNLPNGRKVRFPPCSMDEAIRTYVFHLHIKGADHWNYQFSYALKEVASRLDVSPTKLMELVNPYKHLLARGTWHLEWALGLSVKQSKL